MIFETFDQHGKRVFHTHDEGCIPTKQQLTSMMQNGYKFKLDGKRITKNQLAERYSKKGDR